MRLLIYSRTTGYRHDSIPAGVGALRGLDGYSVDATEDAAVFRAGILRDYAVIVFLSTSGEVLDDAGREALTGYMETGGAWLGIHGTDHPIAWCHERLGGRSFYTALGHTGESFAEPAFLRHLRGALSWLTSA